MNEAWSDFLDSQLSSILGMAVLLLILVVGVSSITTSCQAASVACVEAGGNFDANDGVCEQP